MNEKEDECTCEECREIERKVKEIEKEFKEWQVGDDTGLENIMDKIVNLQNELLSGKWVHCDCEQKDPKDLN